MNENNTEIVSFSNYNSFKECMDDEVKKQAEGFVKIGYLLKLARDTDILVGSGYNDVNEFAEREYRLTRDVVSRYIDINTKYSEGGCSDRLQEKYRAYGYSKLSEMLTIPDHIAEELTPEYTRAEIREIKAELKEESKTTDLELMLERQQDEANPEETLLSKLMHEYFREHTEEYLECWDILWNTIREGTETVPRKIIEVLAPSGTATLIIRIPGSGRYLVSIREDKEEITVKHMRDETFCEIYTWEQFDDCLDKMCGDMNWSDEDAIPAWEERYSLPFPKEPEKEEKPSKPDKKVAKKESKVKKTVPKKEKSVPKAEETVPKLPEKEEIAPAQQPENAIKTECELEIEIEKVEGEVVDSKWDSRKAMIIKQIHEDKKRLNQLLEEKAWTGAKLAAVDLQMSLEQLIAWITREESAGNADE